MTRLIGLIFLLIISLPAYTEVNNIGNDELKRLIADGVPVIDVRRPEEWVQTGVVEGSHLLTFFDKQGRYDVQAWMAVFSKIADPEEPFVLICRTGNRTGTISRFMDQKLNYQRVSHVAKGITYWIKRGNPTVQPSI